MWDSASNNIGNITSSHPVSTHTSSKKISNFGSQIFLMPRIMHQERWPAKVWEQNGVEYLQTHNFKNYDPRGIHYPAWSGLNPETETEKQVEQNWTSQI